MTHNCTFSAGSINTVSEHVEIFGEEKLLDSSGLFDKTQDSEQVDAAATDHTFSSVVSLQVIRVREPATQTLNYSQNRDK